MKKNTIIRKTISILLILVLGMMLLSGCGDEEDYVEKNGNQETTEDKGESKEDYKDEDGSQEDYEDGDGSQEVSEEDAEELYKEKIRSIADKSEYFSYLITDIVEDEVPELLIQYCENGERHGSFKIYACRDGELEEILDGTNDNLQVYQYDESGAILTNESYHDYQGSNYYEYKDGKYHLQAVECYNEMAETSHWYEDGNDNQISETEFNELVEDLRVGDEIDFYVDDWSSEI